MIEKYFIPFIYMLRALKHLFQPKIRLWVFIPLIVNLLIYAFLLYYALSYVSLWIDFLLAYLPTWLYFIRYLLYLLFFLAYLIFFNFTFVLVSNLFCSALSTFIFDAFEEVFNTKSKLIAAGKSTKQIAYHKQMLVSLKRECSKLLYIAPRFLFLTLFSFVPVINSIVIPILFFYTLWFLAIEYLDIAMDANEVDFKTSLALIKENKIIALVFGLAIFVFISIPVLNLLMMPSAIGASSLIWQENHERKQKENQTKH